MKTKEFERLIQGQTSQAKKTYMAVPAQERWTRHQIMAEIKRQTGTEGDVRIVQACLNALCDAGLIKSTEKAGQELYSRTVIQPRLTREQRAELADEKAKLEQELMSYETEPKTQQHENMTTKPTKSLSICAIPGDTVLAVPVENSRDSLDVLSEVAAEVHAMGQEFANRLYNLSMRIESVALNVAQDRENDHTSLEKLRQLQNLLRGI